MDKVLKEESPDIQKWLQTIILQSDELKNAFEENRAGIVLADVTDIQNIQWASLNENLEIYGASVPKLGILLGILYNNAFVEDSRKDILDKFSDEISLMIKKSNNLESGKLYALTSQQSIEKALIKYGLFDKSIGGMWCGAVYNTDETIRWFKDHQDVSDQYVLDFTIKKSPKSGELFATTAAAGALFFKLLLEGNLIDEKYSLHAKEFLKEHSTSKFLKGILRDEAPVTWYGKTGTYNGNLSEVALIKGHNYQYILSFLITGHRDNKIFEDLAEKTNRFIRSLY